MATPLDVTEFTAKERDAARKDLIKKIESYNKKVRKSKTKETSSFPLSAPQTQDLVYRGVIRITYDRGYAIQTKSMLVGSDSVTEDLIRQLIEVLGLSGKPEEYVLEERNHSTHSTRVLGKTECPLNLQLQYGAHAPLLEVRLVKISEESRASSGRARGETQNVEKEDEKSHHPKRGNSSITPKDEVTDHGAANIEQMMDEALEDLPGLVSDIKEELRLLSTIVAHEGKPRSQIPSRRALWDTLKPQVSTLVKHIRHLVDNEEWLVTRHCPSDEFRLVVTLLLELITDYSRELITVTKELCGLKGAARTDLETSVGNFLQQIKFISNLVERSCDCLRAAALSGYLLHATAPENFLKGQLDEKSYFVGSGRISGVLVFTTITAYLGLIRAAYEDKADYFAALAHNMLQSTGRALEKIQESKEYSLIHLHPLRSRIMDMEHKLKVAMDKLVKRVKTAASKETQPAAVPDLLIAGHTLIIAMLDYLLVAQCASLLHEIGISGWELLQLPWVQGWASSRAAKNNDDDECRSSSPISSTTSGSTAGKSIGTLSSTSSSKRHSKERKSRIASHPKVNGTEFSPSSPSILSIEQLTLQPSHLPLNYNGDSGEDADDEGTRSMGSSDQGIKPSAPNVSPVKPLSPHLFSNDSSHYMGIDAVKRLRKHHILNKAISKVAESLLLKVTQTVQFLTQQCRENSKENYHATVDEILRAARHLRDEVSAMECDVLGSSNMQETLDNSGEQLKTATISIYMSLSAACTPQASDRDRIRLMTSATHISEICTKTIRDALTMVSDHKKALAQAEKLEEEFVALMTGHRIKNKRDSSNKSDSSPSISRVRKAISGAKLPSDHDPDTVIFEEISPRAFMPGSAWTATTTPKIIGGTLMQLLQRLTHERTVEPEFVETFILAFHRFLPCEQLLSSLIERYHIKPDSTDLDPDTVEIDILIPIRLRVVHALRLWLKFHPQDFTSESPLRERIDPFLRSIEGEMGACSKQLQKLLQGDRSSLTHRMKKQTSQPIEPIIKDNKFSITDSNTLELARQLCIKYFNLFSQVQLKEFSMLAWESERDQGKLIEKIPGLTAVKLFSRNLSKVVTETLLADDEIETQSLIISYFIKSAESCLQLNNFEAVAAIIAGLTSDRARTGTGGAWELVSDSQISTLKSLQESVSKEGNYQRFHAKFKTLHLVPNIPLIDALLSEVTHTHHGFPDALPNHSKDVINFTKWRKLGRHLLSISVIQNTPYTFMPVEIIQEYFNSLQLTES